MIHFILGGARSGKSRFAEKQVLDTVNRHNFKPVYIATATAIDDEMAQRIRKHQADRIDHAGQWELIECPMDLSNLLFSIEKSQHSETPHRVYLLDCLTLWLNNQLFSKHQEDKQHQQQHLSNEIKELLKALSALSVDIVIVSNEVGLGVIPMGESTRLYVDYCGWLNQRVADISDKVTLVTAGIPLLIKPNKYI